MLGTLASLPFCSMQTSLERGLGVGELNNFTEDDSISASDQSLGQLKTSEKG